MAKQLVRKLDEYHHLFRDPANGIAWVENYSVGIGHSAHPNIHQMGSVPGMVKRGYWNKDDKTVRSHGWTYNISVCVVSDEYDEIARQHCQCGGKHE